MVIIQGIANASVNSAFLLKEVKYKILANKEVSGRAPEWLTLSSFKTYAENDKNIYLNVKAL